MTDNQTIKDGDTYILRDGGYGKIQFKLQSRQSLEFSVQDHSGQQKYFIVDVFHCNPSEQGSGKSEINWEVNLQWWEGIDGTRAWRKVVTIKNRSRSEQHIEVLIHDIPIIRADR